MARFVNWFFIVFCVSAIITNLVFLAIDFSFKPDIYDWRLRIASMIIGCIGLAYELTERDRLNGRR